jgi:hypothetical protein
MPEIGSSGLMSGDGKRGVGHRPQATAPILDSTETDLARLRSEFNPKRTFDLARSEPFASHLSTTPRHK